MMRVYFCSKCKRCTFTNNKSRATCCNAKMILINVNANRFFKMDIKQRIDFLQSYFNHSRNQLLVTFL